MKKALIIVDVQKDFCPGGALPAASAPAAIPVINKIVPQFDYVIASKDWHPEKTIHFDKWPVHCVANTDGASFHGELQQDKIDLILYKGTGNKDDGYSAFEATNEELVGWFAFSCEGDCVALGLGLRPDLTGRGFGLAYLEAGLAFAEQRFRPSRFRLSVATFNERAIRVYERAGFTPLRTFDHATNGGIHQFLEMTRPA